MKFKLKLNEISLNISAGIIYQLLYLVCGFILRKFIVENIDLYFLGVNSVFGNLITWLTLLDFGIGSSGVFFLYKSFSKNNDEFASVYGSLKSLYKYVSVGTLLVGLILCFNIDFFMEVPMESMNYVRTVFMIQIFASVIRTTMFCKRQVIICIEKIYYCYIIDIIVLIAVSASQCIALIVCKSYLYFCTMSFLGSILCLLLINYVFYKKLKFVKCRRSTSYKSRIVKYAKPLALTNLNGIIYGATDSIIISKILGVITVGIISNYYLIVNAANSTVAQLFNSISAKAINTINRGSETKNDIYNQLCFNCFFVASFCCVFLTGLTDTFISLFFGKQFVMENGVIICMAFNVVLTVFNSVPIYFITAMGLAKREVKFAIIMTIMNLAVSIILTYKLGVTGVLIGTVIANTFILLSRDYIVQEKIENFSFSSSIFIKTKYLLIILVQTLVVLLFNKILDQSLKALLLMILTCVIIFAIGGFIVIKLFAPNGAINAILKNFGGTNDKTHCD